MKLRHIILCFGLLFPAITLLGQSGDNPLPKDVLVLKAIFTPDSQTNMTFIVYGKCPAEYTNVLANTNLFSSAEQELLADFPLKYKNVTTNSGPIGSDLVGLNKTNGNWVALFQYTNSEAQEEVTFTYFSNMKSIKFRTVAGDGYNLKIGDINGISILDYDQVKHWMTDGLSVAFSDDHCMSWMHFVNGKAVNKWLKWGENGGYLAEIKIKTPIDYFKYMENFYRNFKI